MTPEQQLRKRLVLRDDRFAVSSPWTACQT